MVVVHGRFRRWLQAGIRGSRFLPLLVLYAIITFFLKEQLFSSVWIRLSTRTGLESDVERELCLIQVLFRHGHRSPFALYPNDPNPGDVWREGLGQLTMLGRLQHYAVGEYLRKWYDGFLSLDPLEVHCLSSGAKRCRFGGYALLAGMYPPPPHKMIDEDLPWQPIPVDYNPERNDKWLQSTATCPKSEDDKRAAINSSEAEVFIQKYKDLYELLSEKSGFDIRNFEHASSLYKTLVVQKSMNLIIPDWAEERWDDLVVQGGLSYYFNFRTKLIQRLRAGPLIELVLERMIYKMKHHHLQKKVYLYSGHGSNLAALLMAFDLFNKQMPPYTSFVTFELYRTTSATNDLPTADQYSVRMLYTNCSVPEETIPPPNVLVIPGCTEYCPFEYLERFTKPLIPDDWEQECFETAPRRRRRKQPTIN